MPLNLEVFNTSEGSVLNHNIVTNASQIDAYKKAAYEEGYKAGWDDSAQTLYGAREKMVTKIHHELRNSSLTYEEAQKRILESIESLIKALMTTLLPKIANEALLLNLADIIRPYTFEITKASTHVITNKNTKPLVEEFLANHGIASLSIKNDESLRDGQVSFKLEGEETQIDLNSAMEKMSQAIRNYFEYINKESNDG